MTTPTWVRVNRDHHCPICDRPDWCLIAPDGSAAICARIAAGAVKRINDSGWLHRLRDRTDWQPTRRRIELATVSTTQGQSDLAELSESFRGDVVPGRLAWLASALGVSPESLSRLRIGWCEGSRAWSFPMLDHRGRTLGIRLRTEAGRKFSVKCGHEGLFIPGGLDGAEPLLIAEGPTDTAALLDLGFAAIGRPSCRGGTRLILDLIRAKKPSSVVIVSDNDEAGWGQAGAVELAGRCRLACKDVRVITPPSGIKDARAWVRSGATRSDLDETIRITPPHRVSLRTAPAERRCRG